MPHLRHRHAGRVEPRRLEQGPLGGPRHDGVALDERPHGGDLRVDERRDHQSRNSAAPAAARHRSTTDPSRAATSLEPAAGPTSSSSRASSPALRGRPTWDSGSTPAIAATCSRASACHGAPSTRPTTCSDSEVACTAPRSARSTGSDPHSAAPLTSARTRATGTSAPSRAALARAPRTRDSAAASGMRRRNASSNRSRVHASRAASPALGDSRQLAERPQPGGDLVHGSHGVHRRPTPTLPPWNGTMSRWCSPCWFSPRHSSG